MDTLTFEVDQIGPQDFSCEIAVNEFSAKDWYESCTDRHRAITGSGDLACLVQAASLLRDKCVKLLPGQRMWAVAGDDTRVAAYRRLTRYGFAQASEFGFNSDGSQWRGNGCAFVFNA